MCPDVKRQVRRKIDGQVAAGSPHLWPEHVVYQHALAAGGDVHNREEKPVPGQAREVKGASFIRLRTGRASAIQAKVADEGT
jgi:hypothetical protein